MADARSARGLFFLAPRHVEVRDVPLLPATENELDVRALASGVSRGTELLLFRGEGPEPFDPSLGTQTYPCRYGYAWVGETADGERVFSLAPHGDRHCLSRAMLRSLPPHIPAARAVLAANLETALTCVWDTEIAFGERALVFGAGVVGVTTAWLLARSGAKVTLVEPLPLRRDASRVLLGERVTIVDRAVGAVSADVVVEATGNPSLLDDAIRAAAFGARIVLASFYGTRRAPIALGDAFHRRRLRLIASQVSTMPPRLAPAFDATRRFALVVELLEEPKLDALLAPPVPFERAAELYAALDANPDGPPQPVFVYR